jgi:hypothetical protein
VDTDTDRDPTKQGSDGQAAAGEDEQKSSLEQQEREGEEAKEEIRKIEEDPPEKLEDWPKGKAKYETFGGPEGEHGYHEGPEQNLGPSSLRHLEGGDVEIEGEKVENPDEYKGEPIPGGPTDPDAPRQPGERELEKEEGVTVDDPEGSGESEEESKDE